jgi:hypothetical protein
VRRWKQTTRKHELGFVLFPNSIYTLTYSGNECGQDSIKSNVKLPCAGTRAGVEVTLHEFWISILDNGKLSASSFVHFSLGEWAPIQDWWGGGGPKQRVEVKAKRKCLTWSHYQEFVAVHRTSCIKWYEVPDLYSGGAPLESRLRHRLYPDWNVSWFCQFLQRSEGINESYGAASSVRNWEELSHSRYFSSLGEHNVHCRVQKSMRLIPVLSQINVVHNFTSYLLNPF